MIFAFTIFYLLVSIAISGLLTSFAMAFEPDDFWKNLFLFIAYFIFWPFLFAFWGVLILKDLLVEFMTSTFGKVK